MGRRRIWPCHEKRHTKIIATTPYASHIRLSSQVSFSVDPFNLIAVQGVEALGMGLGPRRGTDGLGPRWGTNGLCPRWGLMGWVGRQVCFIGEVGWISLGPLQREGDLKLTLRL